MNKLIVILTKSNRKNKKFRVYFPDRRKTIHFGDSRYSDYTIHHNPGRKSQYIARHRKRENWNDFYTAGFWSYHLLWNKRTIDDSIKDIESNYNLDIINNS